MSESRDEGWVRAGTVAEVTAHVVVVQGADRRVAVWAHDGKFFAVDDRCPHLGFPLHKGTCKDGILTCHWHQARFDLCGGGTFDPWADDVPAFDTKVDANTVWVRAWPRQRPDRAYYAQRLDRGMTQNQPLLQAKALVGLLHAGATPREILHQIADFAAVRASAPTGLTELAITGNLLPVLTEETTYLLLLRSARVIAG